MSINNNDLRVIPGFVGVNTCQQPRAIKVVLSSVLQNYIPASSNKYELILDLTPYIDQGKIDFIQGLIINQWANVNGPYNTTPDYETYFCEFDFGNGYKVYTDSFSGQNYQYQFPVLVNNPAQVKVTVTRAGGTLLNGFNLDFYLTNYVVRPFVTKLGTQFNS